MRRNLGLVLLNNRDHLRLDAIPQLLNLFIGLAKRNFSIVEIHTNGLYSRASLVGYLLRRSWDTPASARRWQSTHTMRRTHDDSADKIAILAGLARPTQNSGNNRETTGSVEQEEVKLSDCVLPGT